MSAHALLESCMQKLATRGQGILAADESTATIGKRFETIGLPNEENHRRSYRELLLTTPNIAQYINGVIFYEETLKQSTASGKPFVKLLEEQGILPGIKVDLGLVNLPLAHHEKVTKGLDNLAERLVVYREQGARFAKWRAIYTISDTLPSCQAVKSNAELLARYAALCQDAGIVPIVEPEVLMDGDHTIERCRVVTQHVLLTVFDALLRHHVALKHIVLKPSMVISGSHAANRADAKTVAEITVNTLKNCVPAAVRTINFLSGGQSDQEATLHLDLMNKIGSLPWNLSFSYGRALQSAAMHAWHGKVAQVKTAQETFYQRVKFNGLAAMGEYNSGME